MKNIEVLSAARTIVMSSAFEKKTRKFGSTEYNMLQQARHDNPGYTEVIREFKTNTKQDRYKGLTYDYMRWYIPLAESEEDAPAVLAGLEYLINVSKSHSNCKRYPTVKSWFLKRYPDVEIFGMDDEKLDEKIAQLIEKHKQQKEKKHDSASATPDTAENQVSVIDLPATGTEG